MIAADVHGKNHHKDGCFGNFVEWIELIDASGALVRCSRSENPELFAWTTGGMGLTGVMLRAAIRLLPVETGWIRQRTIVAAGLSQVMQAFEEAAAATYSVAWIDCLAGGARQGRSLLMLGEHATMAELPGKHHADRYAMSSPKKVSVPFSLPSAVLNPLTVKAMNEAYFQAGRRKEGVAYISWDSYFYPLDSILHWNRVYGPRGFMQFQCALPLDTAHAGLSRILDTVGEARSGSFLAVLKRFGAQGDGFSFPMDGYTLTLDFAVSEKATALVDRLAGVTAEHGGRFYLAKDSRLSAAMLDKADERTPSFRAMRAKTGASARFQSLQSQRLLL
jgi:decaprenylphospho-beta-D-ribofuranose 2-oxidase